MVIVPLYETLGAEAMTFICNQAELQLVVCGDYKKIKSLCENASKLPALRHLVVIKDEEDLRGKSVINPKLLIQLCSWCVASVSIYCSY